MKILVVRHGETANNKERIHQPSDTPLSASGEEQAKKIASRLSHIAIDKIFVSPLPRAQKTAEIINEKVRARVITKSELEEIKRPSTIVGKKYADPTIQSTKYEILMNIADPDWHHSDEENFHDIKKRMVSFLEMMEKEPPKSTLLIVTHSYIAKMFFSYIMLGPHMTAEGFWYLYNHALLSNTGLAEFEFTDNRGWRVITWNDTTHF